VEKSKRFISPIRQGLLIKTRGRATLVCHWPSNGIALRHSVHPTAAWIHHLDALSTETGILIQHTSTTFDRLNMGYPRNGLC